MSTLLDNISWIHYMVYFRIYACLSVIQSYKIDVTNYTNPNCPTWFVLITILLGITLYKSRHITLITCLQYKSGNFHCATYPAIFHIAVSMYVLIEHFLGWISHCIGLTRWGVWSSVEGSRNAIKLLWDGGKVSCLRLAGICMWGILYTKQYYYTFSMTMTLLYSPMY